MARCRANYFLVAARTQPSLQGRITLFAREMETRLQSLIVKHSANTHHAFSRQQAALSCVCAPTHHHLHPAPPIKNILFQLDSQAKGVVGRGGRGMGGKVTVGGGYCVGVWNSRWMCCNCWEKSKDNTTDSTENATSSESTKSRISDSSVSHCTNAN